MKRSIGSKVQQQKMTASAAHKCASSMASLLVSVMIIASSGNQFNTCLAAPLLGDGLSLSLTSGSAADSPVGQQSKLMEQIMSDDFSHDFELSIGALNHLAGTLEEFVKREQMTDHVAKSEPVMQLWAQAKGGSSLSNIMNELDFILRTFWTQFKPLIEQIISQRPDNLGANDLDFRCKRQELTQLKALSEQSSIYSMYLDTFYSELNLHCLLRKLALLKNNHVSPPALVKQFVDIYLDLPTAKNPMHAGSKELQQQAAHQILAGQAINFNTQEALARTGPLSSAAHLVFDPKTALFTTSDSDNRDHLIDEFAQECQAHVQTLQAVWGDFDSFASYFTSETCNLVTLNEKVKRAAPQLVYASICSELLKLPR